MLTRLLLRRRLIETTAVLSCFVLGRFRRRGLCILTRIILLPKVCSLRPSALRLDDFVNRELGLGQWLLLFRGATLSILLLLQALS